MRMRTYRLAILRKEFPFIDRLSEAPNKADSISIKRGDVNLLSQTGNEDSYSWSGGGHYDYTKYFAVTGEEVVELDSAGKSATGGGDWNEWSAPTVGEQLFSQGIVPDWIVECRQNDTDDNGRGRTERRWVIYKMIRFDLAGYHMQQVDRAASALKAEIEAACAEPAKT